MTLDVEKLSTTEVNRLLIEWMELEPRNHASSQIYMEQLLIEREFNWTVTESHELKHQTKTGKRVISVAVRVAKPNLWDYPQSDLIYTSDNIGEAMAYALLDLLSKCERFRNHPDWQKLIGKVSILEPRTK